MLASHIYVPQQLLKMPRSFKAYATLLCGLCQSSSVTMPRCGIAFPFPVLGTSYPFLSLFLEQLSPHPYEIYLQTPRSFSTIYVVPSGVNEPMPSLKRLKNL